LSGVVSEPKAPRQARRCLTWAMYCSRLQQVTPKTASTFRIDDELLEALRTVKQRDGIPISEQVRRALLAWVESKGVQMKSDRKRATTRKRP
jgi:hypothetical protein